MPRYALRQRRLVDLVSNEEPLMLAPTDVTSDPTGFPMVWFKQLGAFVHWLPVTKIQFERFLCAAPDAYFDAAWYGTVLSLNPRVTPREISPDNYWQALMTAVRPAEAQRYASWCGDGFRLLSEEEWMVLYRALRARPAIDLAASRLLDCREVRTRDLLERMNVASHQAAARMHDTPGLASQMLLRYGAMEWVRSATSPSGWSAKGEPFPDFCGNLEAVEDPAAMLATELDSQRLPAAGFRLLWFPPTVPEQLSQEERFRTEPSTGG